MAITTATTTTASSHPPIQVKDHIELTPKEKEIFDRLLQVIRHFDLETELRVAGGWVRDKLLGKDSDDIDIAIDTMSGREFCEKINEYLSYTGEETPGIGLIQCNPDQSKHLETARMRLFDVWIDFVNLRSEDYSESSRIPVMRFGTAKEDAYRRDLTINSMFYNINKDSVEDLTERGISDLKSGKIVTPLPPKQTFLDDPLRVLRAIRFGLPIEFDAARTQILSSPEIVSLHDTFTRVLRTEGSLFTFNVTSVLVSRNGVGRGNNGRNRAKMGLVGLLVMDNITQINESVVTVRNQAIP
ncbi:unnamed protein product [Coffea canephora]|uniref:Poly A polymerase head domain-containing protein n=1 Tax=Coffea canephora TaxID=49390 RepID=A0A068VAV6_COFCA|nr:unnamed protein product [Coffea canephora]